MSLTEERFKKIVVQALDISPAQFHEALQIGDLQEWDSVSHLDLLFGLEKEFGVQFSTQKMTELTSLKLLRAEIERLQGA